MNSNSEKERDFVIAQEEDNTTMKTIFHSNMVHEDHEENEKIRSLPIMMENRLKKQKRHSNFNKKFFKLRENLKFERISRKCQFDSLLKKVKAKVFKTINEALKKCLIDTYKLPRLPQLFITNIKIEFNKQYLGKTILEIYQEHGVVTTIEEFIENNWVKEDKTDIFKEFVMLTFREVYEYYITSKQYIRDREKISEKEGEKLAQLFAFIAGIFVEYYTISKGNKPKRPRKKAEKKSTIFQVVPIVGDKNSEPSSM